MRQISEKFQHLEAPYNISYSDTLNPHISDLFKAQLVVHWSTRHTFLSPSLSVLIHCSVNQLWSEYFYSSPSCWFHSLNQKCSLNLLSHTREQSSQAVVMVPFPHPLSCPEYEPHLSFISNPLSPRLSSAHTHWVMSSVGAVLNYSSSHVT